MTASECLCGRCGRRFESPVERMDHVSDAHRGALSRLFVTKGLTVRRQVEDAGARKYEYHPTKQLREEIDRLGDYDTDKVQEGHNPSEA